MDMSFFEWLILAIIAALLAAAAWIAYNSVTSTHIALKKDGWECTKTRTILMPVFVPQGNGATTLIQQSTIECVQYSMKG